MSRAFRFGVEMMEPFDGLTWAQSARELESTGYSTLFVPDHFDEGYGPITAMATAAAATTTLRVASAVLATDFRHPAVVARELASIDQLSGGRLEVGVGAGYQVRDYETSGIAMDPPSVRVDRLIEYVAVLRGLFGDGPFSFNGMHFQVTDLNGTPAPYRPGGPPIFVAGGGKRMLTFAAAHADIVGVCPSHPVNEARRSPATDALAAGVDEKLAWVRGAAGDRFDSLEIHAWLQIAQVTSDRSGAASALTAYFDADVDEVLRSPFVLVGEVEQVIETLLARRERWGFSYYTIQQDAAREFAPVLAGLA